MPSTASMLNAIRALPSYEADDEGDHNENVVEQSVDKEGYAQKQECTPLMRVAARKKRSRYARQLQSPSKPTKQARCHYASSPSMTDWTPMSMTRVDSNACKQEWQTKTTGPLYKEPPMSVQAISQLLDNYFLRQKAESKVTKDQNFIPSNASSTVASSVILVHSYNPIKMEEALRFTSNPRVLFEAEHPHRVVYSNAAFARLYNDRLGQERLCKAANIIGKTSRTSLSDVISTIFSGRPVTVSPVQDSNGTGTLCFYSVDYIMETDTFQAAKGSVSTKSTQMLG